MSLQFFAPKTLGSFCIGGGSIVGGGLIYYYQRPTNWKELLIKEGFVFLTSDDDYKGMFHDQQNEQIWKNESDLKDATLDNVKTKTETYCQNKLEEYLPLSLDSSYAETKKKLTAFCTTDGIKSVKARLVQNKKTNWIEDNQEDKWQTVFAVYRYDSRFIEWLKEDSGDSNLNSKSNVSSEWEKLKNACTKLLAKSYIELTNDKYFEYGSWWCTDLGYATVNEKIKKDSSWEQETEGSNIKKRWKETESVTQQIKTDLNKGQDGGDLQDDDYKKWCTEQLEKKLKDDDYYQTKYLMFKSVCRKIN